MNLARKITILMAMQLLAGCASHLSKEQCQTTNWQQVGYRDGERGDFRSMLVKEEKDCARFSMTVDNQAYGKGWEEGVRAFCQPMRATQLGVQGKTFNPVCPEDLTPAFERAWRRGLREYCIPETGYQLGRSGSKLPGFCAPDQAVDFSNAYQDGYRQFQRIASLKSELNQIENEIHRKERTIANNRNEIDHLNRKLTDAAMNREGHIMRESYRRKIDELHRCTREDRHDLTRLSVQKMAAQTQLSRAEAQG